MSETHRLKCRAVYYDAVERGEKTFEVRFDDRGFQKGDLLELERLPEPDNKPVPWISVIGEQEPANDPPSLRRRVTLILTDAFEGLQRGYVVLGLGPAD